VEFETLLVSLALYEAHVVLSGSDPASCGDLNWGLGCGSWYFMIADCTGCCCSELYGGFRGNWQPEGVAKSSCDRGKFCRSMQFLLRTLLFQCRNAKLNYTSRMKNIREMK
jgi:hypothetical protein